MIIVDLIGKPCAGKSVLASQLFSELKIKGYNVELVQEYAKDLFYEENNFLIHNQLHIFSEQLWRLRRLQNKVDIVITDTSLLLGLIYSKEPNPHFNDLLLWEYNNLNHFTYFLNKKLDYKEEGRFHNEEQANEIHNNILNKLYENNINFNVIDDNYLNTIINDIETRY